MFFTPSLPATKLVPTSTEGGGFFLGAEDLPDFS